MFSPCSLPTRPLNTLPFSLPLLSPSSTILPVLLTFYRETPCQENLPRRNETRCLQKAHYQSGFCGNSRKWENNILGDGDGGEATSRRGSREHTTPEEACPNRGSLHSQQSKLGEEDSTTEEAIHCPPSESPCSATT